MRRGESGRGRLVKQGMEQRPAAYSSVRAAVNTRLDQVGRVEEERGLFMLAADMATTEQIFGDTVTTDDRRQRWRLWNDLRRR